MTEIDLGRYTLEEVKAYWAQMEERNPPAEDPGPPYIFFRIGQQWFAIPIEACKWIEPYRKSTPLPVQPPHILGITSLKGRPVTVTDLGFFFGIKSEAGKGHLIMVKAGNDETALKVDWVARVAYIRQSEVEQEPQELKSLRVGLVTGAARKMNSLILILDAQRCIKAVE